MRKHYQQMSFSHYDVSQTTAKNTFYTQRIAAINWETFENETNKHYSPGNSATGQSAYPCILLFKMLLVGFWSGSISDRDVRIGQSKPFCDALFESAPGRYGARP